MPISPIDDEEEPGEIGGVDDVSQDYPEEDSTVNLYAWYNSSINTFQTVYTTSETPTNGDHIYYDVSLNQVISNPTADYYYMGGTSVSSVSGTTLTTTSNTTYDRDASRDIIRSVETEPSEEPTVITPNATLYIGSQAYIPVFYTSGTPPKYNVTVDNFLGDVDSNGVLQAPSVTTNLVFDGVEDIGSNVLYYKFYGRNNIGSVSFPDLTEISGNNACYYAFNNCTSLTTADLSALTTISGQATCEYMFNRCTALTSVNLSSLLTINGFYSCQYMFRDCTNLTTADLSSLATVSGQYDCQWMYYGCSSLTSVDLSSLTTISGNYGCQYMFYHINTITTADLSSLTTVSGESGCYSMFEDVLV